MVSFAYLLPTQPDTTNRMRALPFALAIVLCAVSISSALRIHTPVTVETTSLPRPERCIGAFTPHELDHITEPVSLPIGFYDSNGAGLALGDLDQDGLIDIALANLAGDNAILWNLGGLRFKKQTLPSKAAARAAAIIDVDGDGWLDVVFTQQVSAPLYWRNQAGGGFAIELMRGVSYFGYAMNWLDADGDGDMDMVTGSYDVENEKLLGLSAPKAGVIYYENLGDRFRSTRLSGRSNTLAIHTALNDAGEYEIIIGNDFAVPDRYFGYRAAEWIELPAPDTMPHSTMSYDSADLDNDGAPEIFAVDMKPYASDDATMAQWQPVMDMMMAMPHAPDDPQIMENVLYQTGLSANIAPQMGLDGTGWSWSTKFGDLDNDGWQDLYVVNGMISREMFFHLPDNELVEENQAYRNFAGGRFVSQPGWALNDRASGRGMSLADMDNDGDLDVVVNNLAASAMLFENQLCGGVSLAIELRDQTSRNTHGIGARLTLETDRGAYRRDVTALSGYLSGDASRTHFGFPAGSRLLRLTIQWRDGETSVVDELRTNALTVITRG